MLARLALLFAGLTYGAESPSGTSVAEAREALAFWRDRRDSLSWHRRAARREARTMVSRSRGQLVRAHLEHRNIGQLAPVLEPLVFALGRGLGDHMRWLWVVVVRRNPLVRRWLLASAAAAVVSLAALALLGAYALHLLAF